MAFKRLERKENDPFGETERRHLVGDGRNIGMQSRWDATDRYAMARAFALVSTNADSAYAGGFGDCLVGVGDAIAWEFAPDAGSNGYAAAADLHIDELILRVRRGDKAVASWIMETCCCPNNSARMVKNVENSEGYKRDAQRVRDNV